ncbi:MAG: hypothetical protein P9L99_03340 [Candidatus Lernaella stagnicola]|nr:hypothetical protein [Candidatus Lernaella stagnicola]
MKKLTVSLVILVSLLMVSAAWAEEISPEWASTVKIGGYVDVRPSFYWFTPDNEMTVGNQTQEDFHYSDVSLYDAGLVVMAQPFDAVHGLVEIRYGEGPIDYRGSNGSLGAYGTETVLVDKAYVQLGSGSSFWVRAGKYYMPFAASEDAVYGFYYNLLQRYLFANPVALGLGYNHKFAGFGFHVWNGQFDTTNSSGRPDNDIIDTYAASLEFHPLAFQEVHQMDLVFYFLSDAAETWGQFGNQINTQVTAYSENIFLYGGYLKGDFFLSDLIGLGILGEYATTGEWDEDQYVDAAGDATAVSFMNAELALLFWEGVLKFGGKYESISGVDYFGTAGVDYEPTSYARYGGFLRSNLMEELSLGLEYLMGGNNESDTDSELQIQTRLDF